MTKPVEIKKNLNASKQEIFRYFTDKKLVEQWSAPEGMTLRVPILEARAGGKYRYEHTAADGQWIASGHYDEVTPDRIVQVDERIEGPEGRIFTEELRGTITLTERGEATEVRVVQTGFARDEDADDCRDGWTQCLDNLDHLLRRDAKGERLSRSA